VQERRGQRSPRSPRGFPLDQLSMVGRVFSSVAFSVLKQLLQCNHDISPAMTRGAMRCDRGTSRIHWRASTTCSPALVSTLFLRH
jgi:hypothetical protein